MGPSAIHTFESTPPPSLFLTQFQEAAIRHGHDASTALAMAAWVRRFILFHGKKHPQEMGRAEIWTFLEHVARSERDALRAIETAHAASANPSSIFAVESL